jgi:hypothetical protein
MNTIAEQALTDARNQSLGEQFTDFEARSRSEFDENGWNSFMSKIIEYQNDLYTGSRRECISRAENELTPFYSGKDVERASVRLDFQRLYARKRKRNFVQLSAMAASLLAGVLGNWAFSDIASAHPSMLPWCLLIVSIVATVGLYHLQAVWEIEP